MRVLTLLTFMLYAVSTQAATVYTGDLTTSAGCGTKFAVSHAYWHAFGGPLLGNVELEGNSFAIKAPDHASPAQADSFFVSLQSIPEIENVLGMPEPLRLATIDRFAWEGVVPEEQFPGDDPDGWAQTHYAHAEFTFYHELDINTRQDCNKLATVNNSNNDGFDVFAGVPFPDLTWAPANEFLPDDSEIDGFTSIPTSYADEPCVNRPDTILGGAVLQMYILYLGGTAADYDSAANTGDQRPFFVFGKGNATPTDIKDFPKDVIRFQDRAFRFPMGGHWYVMQVKGTNEATYPNSNVYNEDRTAIEWNSARAHETSLEDQFVYDGRSVFLRSAGNPNFPVFGHWVVMRQGIGQGDDGGGPLVDPVTGLDDPYGVPSTLVTSYKGTLGTWIDQVSYSDLSDKDKNAL